MDLTFELHQDLKPELCEDIIKRFEQDQRKHPGQTGGGLMPDTKNSLDLVISRLPEWEDIVKILDSKLEENLKKYQEFLTEKVPPNCIGVLHTWHNGYQIQKSGHYKWHHDARIEYGKERVLTFIWYLNTLKNEQEGHTGFLHKSIKPETGKFVFFPATWDYIHCGFPTENKYIITGWTWQEVWK